MTPTVTGLFGVPWLSLAGLFGGGTLGAVLVVLVRTWPLLAKMSIEARAALRAERRDELHDCHKRLDALEARLTAGETRTHSFEVRLISALNALAILATELQHHAPGSSALRVAKRVLLTAYPVEGELPAFIGDILRSLDAEA